MVDINSKFDLLLKGLNPEQFKAVDTVEGPVIVLAGPGTGKTHILTLRIANILKKTQANPSSILALTFTESAVRTMKKRLADIVGDETARKVTIETFHGFAELVRREYPESFESEVGYRLMGDVEEKLLMRDAIDGVDINMLRPSKAPYTYLNDLYSLVGVLRRENMSLDEYRVWGINSAKDLLSNESLLYKKGKDVGKLTKKGLEEAGRFDKVKEAVRVFEKYNELKREHMVIDFSDVLSGVVNKIEENEVLRGDLQERYQYVLADEHQDANAVQHKLLELFAYDDHPNLFVVGDEKQAVYRFQGADLGYADIFTKLFPRASVITLKSSFRSYQHILDSAHSIVKDISNNEELISIRSILEKESEKHVSQIVADNPLSERTAVSIAIEKLIDSGIAPHDIAIVTRKNDTSNLFAQVLTARGISVVRAGNIFLTEKPIMRTLIALMEYVANPIMIGNLRVALLAPWFDTSTVEMLTFLRTTSDRDIVSSLNKVFPDIKKILDDCISQSLVRTPVESFSYIFEKTGARDFFLSNAEHLDDVHLVQSLLMHLESVTLLTKSTTFSKAFEELSKANEHGLSPVRMTVTEREGAVTVITAHKVKGMEFKYVFVVDCTEKTWEKSGRRSFIPSPFEQKTSTEDVKRLFYVALTRAKNHVYISYSLASSDGRDLTPMSLIPKDILNEVVVSEPLPLLHTIVSPAKTVNELVEKYLEKEGLSPSAINEYIESPATFFARRVLRIKEPPIPALVYGSAIHAALAAALSGVDDDNVRTVLDNVFERSLLVRDATFQKLRSDALDSINASLPDLKTLGEPVYIEKSFSMVRNVDNAPVTVSGKIDTVFKQGNVLSVTDFKTGKTVSNKNKSYTRQLSLYAAMLSSNGENIQEALLLGVSSAGIKKVLVDISLDMQEADLADVDTVVRELRSGKWHKGVDSEYDSLLRLIE